MLSRILFEQSTWAFLTKKNILINNEIVLIPGDEKKTI